jgi:hypothetical protein
VTTPSASSNPNDLPLEVALAIEETPVTPTPHKDEAPPDSAANLVDRLGRIRERLFHLQAVWATTLSPDVAREADRYRELFRELCDQLRKDDPDEVERLIVGHEALLLAEPSPPKPTVTVEMQRWIELAAEVRSQRRKPPKAMPTGYVCDGLQSFV